MQDFHFFFFFSRLSVAKDFRRENTFMLCRKTVTGSADTSELWLLSYFSFILMISPTVQRLAEVHGSHTFILFYIYIHTCRPEDN